MAAIGRKKRSGKGQQVPESAKAMAGHQLDRLADSSASSKEVGRRKKRLLEGPEELREIRERKRRSSTD